MAEPSHTTFDRPHKIIYNKSQPSRTPLRRNPTNPTALDCPKKLPHSAPSSIKLVAEVTSSIWQDDYARKVEEYAFLEIPEYWIADFRGLGGIRFISSPKQPTFTVNTFIHGQYHQTQFHLGETIRSPLFPNLQFTLDDIMARRNS